MSAAPDDSRAALRKAAYWLLIAVAAGGMVGRIAVVSRDSRDGAAPFLSANDRSRWSAIRALGDEGTHVIDNVIVKNWEGKNVREKFDARWYTIDMVRHKGHDGEEHYYSSKPTLLNVLLAGEYWLVKKVIGSGLETQTFYVARVMLVLTNVLPMLLYFGLLARLIERYGATDWGRLFTMTAAVFGTFLTTFAVTLNNHLIAAVSVAISLYAALPIWSGQERRLRYFAVAGLAAAFAAANELPALSFLVLLGAALFWQAPRPALVAFLPAVVLVAAASFGTNYQAHGSWKTPYAHRSDGQVMFAMPDDAAVALSAGRVPDELQAGLEECAIDISPAAKVTTTAADERWALWDPEGNDRVAIVRRGDELQVRAWDNWYEHPESYWTSGNKQSVDKGEPNRWAYAIHLLVGHHGFFSLTPIWLLSVVVWVMLLVRWDQRLSGRAGPPAGISDLRSQISNSDGGPALAGSLVPPYQGSLPVALAAMTALLTLVCLAFYISRPLEDRNYGGFTCGLRWLFWLIPMWLLCLLPAADALSSRRAWRVVAVVLLVVSAASAAYAALNPWQHPWFYAYWQYLGWVE